MAYPRYRQTGLPVTSQSGGVAGGGVQRPTQKPAEYTGSPGRGRRRGHAPVACPRSSARTTAWHATSPNAPATPTADAILLKSSLMSHRPDAAQSPSWPPAAARRRFLSFALTAASTGKAKAALLPDRARKKAASSRRSPKFVPDRAPNSVRVRFFSRQVVGGEPISSLPPVRSPPEASSAPCSWP